MSKIILKVVGRSLNAGPPVVKGTRVYCSFLLLFVLWCPPIVCSVLVSKQIVFHSFCKNASSSFLLLNFIWFFIFSSRQTIPASPCNSHEFNASNLPVASFFLFFFFANYYFFYAHDANKKLYNFILCSSNCQPSISE